MSRSYKKTPIIKNRNRPKRDKKQSNRQIRYYKGVLLKGGSHHKIYNARNIHTLYRYETFLDFEESYYEIYGATTLEHYNYHYNIWANGFLRK